MATSMFDATVSILLTGKRSTPMSAPTTVAVSLEVCCHDNIEEDNIKILFG